jgi:hypothetical protein
MLNFATLFLKKCVLAQPFSKRLLEEIIHIGVTHIIDTAITKRAKTTREEHTEFYRKTKPTTDPILFFHVAIATRRLHITGIPICSKIIRTTIALFMYRFSWTTCIT